MIKLRRINNKEFVVNADFIEFVESTPDTVINSHKRCKTCCERVCR